MERTPRKRALMQRAVVVAGVAAVLGAGAPRAQEGGPWRTIAEGHRLRVTPIDGARSVALAVVWPHRHDLAPEQQRAIEHATAEVRATAAQALLASHEFTGQGAGGPSTTVVVHESCTLFQVTLDRRELVAAAAWLRALADDPGASLGEDALAVVLARAALAADDARWLYPGELLRGRARTGLLAGGAGAAPVRGSPEFLQSLSTGLLREAARSGPGAPCSVVVLGAAVDVAAMVAAIAAIPAPGPAEPAGPARQPRPVAAEAAYVEHSRVDAPYVAAACLGPLPGAPEWLPFVVGIEAARQRALLHFQGYRGREVSARAPFVDHVSLAGDPLVVFHRRGKEAVPVDLPRRELEEFLRGLTTRPPGAAEVAAAIAALQVQWLWPPANPALERVLARNPEALAPRAAAMALLGHWGVADGTVRELGAAASVEAVQAALRAALRPEDLWWGGVVARELEIEPGWRR